MTQPADFVVDTDILEHGPPVIADTEPESELVREILVYKLLGHEVPSRPPSGSLTNLWGSHVNALGELLYIEFVRPIVVSPVMISDIWVDTSPSETNVSSVADQLLARPPEQRAAAIASTFFHSMVSAALASGVSADAATDTETRVERRRADLVSHLEIVFADAVAVEEVFEAGFESDFSRRLRAVIMACGDQAIDALAEVMHSDGTDIDTTAEALNQLGLIADPYSHRTRLEMLIRYLTSPDALLRDSASVALAAMDDPVAVEAVRRAVTQEPSPMLRRDLSLVLAQLEETARCSSSG